MGEVHYSLSCSKCNECASIEAHLYSEAKAQAQRLGWGFHATKVLYADIGHGQKRQRAELGTILCPQHQREYIQEQLEEAEKRAKEAEAEALLRIAERPAKFRELAEHLRGARDLIEELDVFIPGIDFDWLAYHAESLAARERSLSE